MSTSSSRAITSAFIELLKETPANKITVKQLAEAAGVTRSSFYNNYADIPTLAQKICVEYAARYTRTYSNLESFPEAAKAAYDLVSRNRRVVLNMFNFLDRDVSETFIHRMTERVVYYYFEDKVKAVSPDHGDIYLTFITDGYFGYIIRWLVSGMREDPRKNFDAFLEIVYKVMDIAPLEQQEA